MDTYAHELAHAIEIEIAKRDRGIEQEIRQWEEEVIAIAKKYIDGVGELIIEGEDEKGKYNRYSGGKRTF